MVTAKPRVSPAARTRRDAAVLVLFSGPESGHAAAGSCPTTPTCW